MTGDLVVADDPGSEEPADILVVFRLTHRRRLLVVDERKLGEVGLVDEVDDDIAAHDLGPDALDLDRATHAELLDRSSAGLKVLLVDQRRIAGLGNIDAHEVLFQARLAPQQPAAGVDEHGVRRLHRQLRRVVERAVEAGADPGIDAARMAGPPRINGAACPHGDGRIERFRLGGRHGFWCPGCQGETASGARRGVPTS